MLEAAKPSDEHTKSAKWLLLVSIFDFLSSNHLSDDQRCVELLDNCSSRCDVGSWRDARTFQSETSFINLLRQESIGPLFVTFLIATSV